MNTNLTAIIFLIDESGSMSHLRTRTIDGYNTFIEEQRKVEGEVSLTTVTFSTRMKTLHDNADLKTVSPLTSEDYSPLGGTALYDAMGDTINRIGQNFAKLPESERPGKVLVCVTTDGQENASCEYTHSMVHEMITEQTTKYNWEFVFLGANIDAEAEAAKVGIRNAFNYTASHTGTDKLYECLASSVSDYRKNGEINDLHFSDLE